MDKKINVGSRVNTKRRKAMIVVERIGSGWLRVRTLAGHHVFISGASVTKVW